MNLLRRICCAAVCLALALLFLPGSGASASIAQPSVVSEDPVDFTPNLVSTTAVPRPHADAIDQLGGTAYVGGLFGEISSAAGSRVVSNMAAFSATTGALRTPFDPAFDGNVWAVEAVPGAVYVGGAFTHVDGLARRALVKLDPVSGAVDPTFDAGFVAGQVNHLIYRDGLLYVAGSSGHKLMALDPATGDDTGTISLGIADPIPDAWGGVAVYGLAINRAGTRLVATGNFQTVAGQPRTRLFVADLGSGVAKLDPWYYAGFAKPCSSTAPRRIAYLQGVDFSPGGAYFVVAATGQIPLNQADRWHPGVTNPPDTTVCDGVGRFNLGHQGTTHQPAWINYTGGDSVWDAAATGPAVYVQGHFRWLDNPDGFASRPVGPAVPRRGIGAIDPGSGLALSWNPDKPARRGGRAFLATSAGLWIGSDSETFHREPHVGIAFAPLQSSP